MATKIIGISGSLRIDSRNTALLEAIGKQVRKLSDIDFEIGSIDLPMYTGNEPRGFFPDEVVLLRKQIEKADGLIITCPEYNWNITTALKNTIDWLSLGGTLSPLYRKVIAIAGVGGGRLGSVRAQMSLRTTLLHNQAWLVPGPEVLISPNDNTFNEQGELNDPIAVGLVDELIRELVRVGPVINNQE